MPLPIDHIETPTSDALQGELLITEPMSQTANFEPAPASLHIDPTIARALDNRLIVIAIVAVAGPLGLPALWFSRRFNRPTKIVATAAYLLLTVVFPLVMVYYWCELALRPLVDAFAGAGV